MSIPDLMELPFNELHELYRIAFLRMQAREKAEKERQEEEEKQKEREENEERRKKGLPPQLRRAPPPDAKKITQQKEKPISSPIEAEELEELFEEMAEGGAI